MLVGGLGVAATATTVWEHSCLHSLANLELDLLFLEIATVSEIDITMSEAEEYEVETIVSKRLRKGRFRGFELVCLPQHASPQEKLSISSSGRGGRTLTTTPGSPLAISSVT